MKLFIQVKAEAKKEFVEKIDEKNYRVAVRAPAREGLANEAVIEALSDHFGAPKSLIKIVSGHKSKRKIVQASV